MKNFMNLQLFGEGGAAAAGTASGATAGAEGSETATGASADAQDLSTIVYGKSDETVAQSNTDADTTAPKQPEDKKKTFENMIKKGGEYAEEFQQYSQNMINKRFKETKNLENQLSQVQPILNSLSMKYGLDVSDIEGISNAIAADDSMLEEAAFAEGLTTTQYREKMALMQENERLRAAEEQQKAEQHSQEIYRGWVDAAEQLKAKYNLQNFDLAAEVNTNPEFTRLLGNGIDFEAAYMATHFNEMLNGAMAQTASKVEQAVANRVASRQARPSEIGLQSSNANSTFKPNVNDWNNNDIDEVIRRVRNGAKIRL